MYNKKSIYLYFGYFPFFRFVYNAQGEIAFMKDNVL